MYVARTDAQRSFRGVSSRQIRPQPPRNLGSDFIVCAMPHRTTLSKLLPSVAGFIFRFRLAVATRDPRAQGRGVRFGRLALVRTERRLLEFVTSVSNLCSTEHDTNVVDAKGKVSS